MERIRLGVRENKSYSFGVDLKEAFGTLDHSILSWNLNAMEWVENVTDVLNVFCLTEFNVYVNNCLSDLATNH